MRRSRQARPWTSTRRQFGLLGGLLTLAPLVARSAAASGGRTGPPLVSNAAVLDRLVFVSDIARPAVAVVDSRDDALLGHIESGYVADVMAIARHPSLLLTANWEEPVLRLIELTHDAEVRRLPLGHSVEHFQLSPDESLVAVVDHAGGGLSLVSLEPPHHVRRVEGLAGPHNIVFAPDGGRLYSSNLGSDRLSIVDVVAGRVLEEISMPFEGVKSLALASNGRHALVLFSGRDEVIMLDLADHQTMTLLTLGTLPFHAYSTMAGERMIIPNNGDATISIVSFEEAQEKVRLEGAADMTAAVPAWFDSLAFVPSREEQRIVVLDLDRERLLATIPLPGRPSDPALEPSGRKLYVPLADRGALAVIDAAERRLLGLIEGVGETPWAARLVGSINYCH